MALITLPQHFKIVNGLAMTTTNAATTGDYVSLKNANYAWVIFKFLHAVGAATTCGINRATAVAGTSATAMTESALIWSNLDVSSSDTLTKRTSAATYEISTVAITNKIVVFGIDPRALAATYDCIASTTTANSEATDFVDVTYILDTAYKQGVPPSAIID